MPTDDKVIAQIETILAYEMCDEDLQVQVQQLLKNYRRMVKRFDSVLKQSDKMSSVVAEQNEKLEHISEKLSKYLSPQVYDQIFSGAQEAELSSKRKKLTVFFSDIVDFTQITSSLESEELTGLLNKYLTDMSEIALEFGATIDKYIGDAIVIFFGDPTSLGYQTDALKCVYMAMKMQRKMVDIRERLIDEGIVKDFKIRCGINTGYCTVGNFGSNDRMDYTIIGDPVNLAARLESSASPGEILLSHETYSLVKDEIKCIKRNAISLKGIAGPIETYEVINEDLIVNQTMKVTGDGFSMDLDTRKVNDFSKLADLPDAIEALLKQFSKAD